MIYNYTWNHIKILASICECDDNKFNISENWVNLVQDHHEGTFPFTLWPLTYRNSAIIASSSISSPELSNIYSSQNCNIFVKLYKSNEVLIVCFQHKVENEKDQLANCDDCISCIFKDFVSGNVDEASDKKIKKIKMKIAAKINKIIINTPKSDIIDKKDNEISCIIFTGYGIGAAMASFMTRETALAQRKRQIFHNEEKPRIIVDCITFESPSNMVKDGYWDNIENVVDKYVDVKHNKFGLETILEENTSEKRKSIFLTELNMENVATIGSYILEIDKKIKIY